jgi:hypothetical protein
VPNPLVRRPIGETEVVQIAALDDPVLRNLWITTAYHDLAVGMGRIVGATNVSWPAFATWASKTAGASIRGDEISGRLRDLLGQSDLYRQTVGRVKARLSDSLVDIDLDIVDAVKDAVAAVSRQIASGNLSVFEELGPLFARMVARFDGHALGDAAGRAALVDSVQAIDGEAAATSRLKVVFEQYCAAMLEPDPGLRADQILLANGLAGLTEQIRLQPNILGALDAPIEASLGEWLERTLQKIRVPARLAARPLLKIVTEEIERVWRRIATEFLMRLVTPSGGLDLGDDVPTRAGQPLFPNDLEHIKELALNNFFREFDLTGGTGVGSAARDWAELPQRMNYIVNLFRSRQQDGEFLFAPFTDAQWADMQEGRVPAGGGL